MSGAEPTVGHIADRVNRIFRERLHLELPSMDTDVVETGTLDSLMFAELIVRLEEEFDTEIDVAEIELDDFRTVSRIARFLAHRRGQNGPRAAPEPGAP